MLLTIYKDQFNSLMERLKLQLLKDSLETIFLLFNKEMMQQQRPAQSLPMPLQSQPMPQQSQLMLLQSQLMPKLNQKTQLHRLQKLMKRTQLRLLLMLRKQLDNKLKPVHLKTCLQVQVVAVVEVLNPK